VKVVKIGRWKWLGLGHLFRMQDWIFAERWLFLNLKATDV